MSDSTMSDRKHSNANHCNGNSHKKPPMSAQQGAQQVKYGDVSNSVRMLGHDLGEWVRVSE